MQGNSSSSRSARASKQLRDSKGRWIEMGSLVKWYDSIDQKEFAGVVTDLLDDGRAVISRTDRPGGFVARVQAHLLEAIEEKATLDKPAEAEKPAVPTKTVKETKRSNIDGFNFAVDASSVRIEQPDGYGSGDSVYLSKDAFAKLSKAVSDQNTDKIALSKDVSAKITAKGVEIVSQSIDPNDGTPGPYNAVTVPLSSFGKMVDAGGVELADKEVPDYSKVPKAAPAPVKAPEPYVPKKPVLAPRHKIADGANKIEITEKNVSIFAEDGYGTGDSATLSKDNFKKLISEYGSKQGSGEKAEIGGQTVTFKQDGSVNLFSRYINPNDGSFGPAKSVTISKKAIDEIMNQIDKPLTASLWSETDIIAQELAIGTKLVSSNDIVFEKVSSELWEYQANSNKISYNNRSIDCFKSVESIIFSVETS